MDSNLERDFDNIFRKESKGNILLQKEAHKPVTARMTVLDIMIPEYLKHGVVS